ncbi:TIGR04222 domain-containing membrane protein [Streptomyces sp. JV185]|uniref:TIGR04222 domain-containing membrane protein n=1 Tax=Streptomyces sp. JV185 TaxID=858638 RepID=UPI002E79BBA7|nr:TIGR04222 domain-containing membrane protein [Streptomyces sp. JV185]MEE1772911.1 TIGR04222 domain-containing membrane protein [Streptomyces sp. JV185]
MLWVLFLLVAWGAAAISCARLCLVSARTGLLSDASEQAGPGIGTGHELTLYETAFLAGGPHRVVDLALATMHLRRRLLLAHTGWATVVDPAGHDEMERTVIRAIGPQGQSRTAPVRAAVATADAVRALADRLVAAGLALPGGAGTEVVGAVRAVRGAALLVVATGGAVLLMPGQEHGPGGPVMSLLVWFGLPFALTVGCLAIARVEIHPYSSWASPAGQRLLAANEVPAAGADRDVLAALAVGGVRAVADPALRAALGGGGGPLR